MELSRSQRLDSLGRGQRVLRRLSENGVGWAVRLEEDFLPAVTGRYVFFGLRHDRRQIVYINVTEHPSAAWVAQQLREAFPFDEAPRFLIRDNDGIYDHEVTRCIESLGIEDVATAPGSPWQNAYGEQVIGTLRRELLDHVIVLNERHLRRLLSAYLDYYHQARCHQSLDDNSPDPREVQPPDRGEVISIPDGRWPAPPIQSGSVAFPTLFPSTR